MDPHETVANFTKKMLSENVFNCAICKDLLTSPVMTVKDVGSVCHNCFEMHKQEEWVYLPNEELNKMLKELKFPCKYEPEGCSVITAYADTSDHQNKCMFRSTKCLMPQDACRWVGKLKDLVEHFRDEHSKQIVESPNDVFTFDYNFIKSTNFLKLLISKNKTYIFRVNETNKDRVLTLFIQDIEEADTEDLNWSISYIGKNGQYRIKSKRSTLNSTDEDCATKVPLHILNEIAEVNGNISITIKPDKYQLKNINGLILKQLECPVCKELMRPPIHQCETGHNLCKNCQPKLKECPSCRGNLKGTRNFALEDITSYIYYQCIYNQFGCEGIFLGSDIDRHEQTCKLKVYDCPISTCNYTGNYLSTTNHFQKNHKNDLSETGTFCEYFTQSVTGQTLKTERYFFRHFNIYKLTFSRTRDTCRWVVRILNPYDQRKKFVYKIIITHPTMQQKKLIKSSLCLNIDTAETDSVIIWSQYNDLVPYKSNNNEQMLYSCEIEEW